MKRITAIALVLMLLVGAFAACGGTEAPEVTPYEGTLTELVTKIYDTYSVGELPVIKEGLPVDMADPDIFKGYTGLDSTDGIAEAVFSESMMGSQAYSLVIAKLSDTSKTEDIKKAMFEGINLRKWICVEADQLRVASSADLVMLVMVNSELGAGHADGIVEAFKTNVGELTGETLTKG